MAADWFCLTYKFTEWLHISLIINCYVEVELCMCRTCRLNVRWHNTKFYLGLHTNYRVAICHTLLCSGCVTVAVFNEASLSVYTNSFLLYIMLSFNIKAVISRQCHLFSVQPQPTRLECWPLNSSLRFSRLNSFEIHVHQVFNYLPPFSHCTVDIHHCPLTCTIVLTR
jgi:hypothetical protein